MDLNDISDPPLFEYGSFRFRKLRPGDESSTADDYFEEMPEHCMSKIESYDDYEDEGCDDDVQATAYNIVEVNGDLMVEMPVPSAFYRHLIGHKGSSKRKMEEETGVKLRIPSMGKEGDVVITSSHRKNILSAITRIELLIETHRKKMPVNYFLAFRATDIGKSFERFKGDVLENCKSKRIDPSLFQNPLKLHLTISVIVLCDNREVKTALSHVQSATDKLKEIKHLTGNGLEVEVKGLEVMNDDLSCVHVLYAKVHDPQNKLQTIADAYVSALEDTGYMSRQYDRVKLHVTLMNSLFRKGGNDDDDDYNNNTRNNKDTRNNNNKNNNNNNKNNNDNRESFDATEIFKRYSNYNFGKMLIKNVELCRKASTAHNGFYVVDGSVII